MYDDVIVRLRDAYNRAVEERETGEVTSWKVEERRTFLSLLQDEGKEHLLEIGAGTGRDGKFFQDSGLKVVATDLSPEMVQACRRKGLTAYEMDFLHLDFPAASFDAVYALNCLLHVPKQDLPEVLQTIRRLLKAGGLFYMGLYGGVEREGEWPEDHYEPKRFFSSHGNEQVQSLVTTFFDLVYFKPIPLSEAGDSYFQSMILRRP